MDKQTACHSERRAKLEVELLRVERSEQAKAQGVAAAGSRNEFRWLAIGMLHRYKKPPKLVAISHRRYRSSVLYRIVAARGSLPQQNFDYENRYAIFFAQNDRLIVCFAVIVRDGRPNGRWQAAKRLQAISSPYKKRAPPKTVGQVASVFWFN